MTAGTGKNAIANLIGSLAGPLIGLVMTPFYLRVIGLEGLGLVGLMTLITAVVSVFVAGISKTYQRDLSAAQVNGLEELAGLVKGGLILFVCLGVILGAMVLLTGHSQIQEMAKGTRFTPETLNHCLILISGLLTLSITGTAISATLVSLRDQIWPNTLGIALAISTAFASWICLSRWPRVDVFYACQLSGAAAATVILGIRCSILVRNQTASIASKSIRAAWSDKVRTSGRLSLVLIVHEGLGVLITQIDRLLVSSHFPLAGLGAYNLGANPSRFVGIFTGPVNTVTYPEFCRLAGDGSSRHLTGEYLGRVTFIMTLLFSSAMIILIPSADDLMNLWLGPANVPKDAPTCFVLLSAGFLLLAIAGPSYNLTVAHGKVGYGIPKNILSLLILPPLGLWFIKLWGLPGAAILSVIYAVDGILICGTIACRRHASFRGGAHWFIRGLCSVGLGILLGLLIGITRFTGISSILISSTVASAFFLCFVIRSFGLSPQSWMRALEIHPQNLQEQQQHDLVTHPPI